MKKSELKVLIKECLVEESNGIPLTLDAAKMIAQVLIEQGAFDGVPDTEDEWVDALDMLINDVHPEYKGTKWEKAAEFAISIITDQGIMNVESDVLDLLGIGG